MDMGMGMDMDTDMDMEGSGDGDRMMHGGNTAGGVDTKDERQGGVGGVDAPMDGWEGGGW